MMLVTNRTQVDEWPAEEDRKALEMFVRVQDRSAMIATGAVDLLRLAKSADFRRYIAASRVLRARKRTSAGKAT
jgi:hypothetical protein